MIESVKAFAVSYEFVSFMALFTYWIPALICLTVYAFRFVAAYRADLKKCTESHYTPTVTIGAIVGHLFLAITPCLNIFTLVFGCASSVFHWLGRVLDMPLVSAKIKAEKNNAD